MNRNELADRLHDAAGDLGVEVGPLLREPSADALRTITFFVVDGLKVSVETHDSEAPFDPFGPDDDHLPASQRPVSQQLPFPAHHKRCAKWSQGPLVECTCPEGWGRREHSGPS